MPAKEPIHIAVAFDQNYTSQFYALLASIFNSNKNILFHFHCVATGIDSKARRAAEQYALKKNCQLFFYEVDAKTVSNLLTKDAWTHAVYYRLFFPFLVPPGVSRLLYLDADTVVVGNLAELYFQPFAGFPVAAVYDNYVKKQPLVGIENEGCYFNSGVLLIDTELWKKQRVTERAIEYLEMYPDRILFVDQCALNAVLKDNWKILDYRFNVLYSYVPIGLSLTETKEFLRDKVVIHFTLERPWKFICKSRLRYLYHQFLSMSPLGKQRAYEDFNLSAVPQWFQIRLIEFYLDNRLLQFLWKFLKKTH
jgi:lipopolysaccharide biosynthesis glycosyltransferase